jgi:hypothetical protein
MNHTPPPALAPSARRGHYRSKTLAAWLALLLGAVGLHRIYLHGVGDKLAWLHVPVSAAGLLGVQRMNDMGQDDHLAWLLIPLLGLMLAQGMLCAIVYALTPDEKWHARHNPNAPAAQWPRSAWGAVFAAALGLLVGGTVLMGTIAFSGQKFFEWQQLQEAAGPKRS